MFRFLNGSDLNITKITLFVILLTFHYYQELLYGLPLLITQTGLVRFNLLSELLIIKKILKQISYFASQQCLVAIQRKCT